MIASPRPDNRASRVAALVSLTVLALMASVLAPLPGGRLALLVLGSELSWQFSGPTQYALILAAVVCASVDAVARAERPGFLRAAACWGLPLIAALASLFLIPQLDWWGYQLIMALLTSAILALVLWLQRTASRELHAGTPIARLALTVVTYTAALAVYVAIYGARLRSIISATGVLLASALLAAELLREVIENPWRMWLYSGLVGLGIAELTWALNYTRLSTNAGAVLLLLAFYITTGITQQHFWGRLNRRVIAEYGIALVVGIAVIAIL